jgi:hypothetical protein
MRTQTASLAFLLVLASAAPSPAQTHAARTTVAFRNELPGTYELQRVRFWIDGALRQEGSAPFQISLAPGRHVVSVVADYRMRDPVLSYVNRFSFELRSAEHVVSEPAEVTARAVEAGGVTTPVDRRARILWQ